MGFIKEIFIKIKEMEKEFIFGRMDKYTWVLKIYYFTGEW
jgi:hypothetical protein